MPEFEYLPLLLSFIAVLFGAVASFISIFVINKNKSVTDYVFSEQKVALSAMREHYEARIADLHQRLTSNLTRFDDVNHLLVERQKRDDNDFITEFRVEDIPILSDLKISQSEIAIDPNLIFVLTPFTNEERDVYRSVRDVCISRGLKCRRGDEEFIERQNILVNIVKQISSARLVIANIGSRNPNVLYELGIAHALGKRTILISRNISEVPFDLRMDNIIVFQNNDDLRRRLEFSIDKIFHTRRRPIP